MQRLKAQRGTIRNDGGNGSDLSGGAGTADALPPEITRIEYHREELPHLLHQLPFNCCSETAVSSAHSSTIEPRPIPCEKLPELLFGPTKLKQKPLRLNIKGALTTVSLAGSARKMSQEIMAQALYVQALLAGGHPLCGREQMEALTAAIREAAAGDVY